MELNKLAEKNINKHKLCMKEGWCGNKWILCKTYLGKKMIMWKDLNEWTVEMKMKSNEFCVNE